MGTWIEDGKLDQKISTLMNKVTKRVTSNRMLQLCDKLAGLTNSNYDEKINLEKIKLEMLQCKVEAHDDVESLEPHDLLDKMTSLTFENKKIRFWLENAEKEAENAKKEVSNFETKVAEEIRERELLHESWKSTLGKVISNNNAKVKEVEKKLKESESLNEKLENRAKDAQALHEQNILEVSKIPKLESELNELKKEHKKELSQQKTTFEAKIKSLEDKNKKLTIELKKAKLDDCPICFEDISLERKWTAFLPCGHRTCTECADKISDLPRSTNRRKCPNCRENINCFLVLEGIYES